MDAECSMRVRRFCGGKAMSIEFCRLASAAVAISAVCMFASGSSWASPTLKAVHSFCKVGGDCPDGKHAVSSLLRDADGNLYGTTVYGGHDAGVVYALLQNGRKLDFKVLHRFCSKANC